MKRSVDPTVKLPKLKTLVTNGGMGRETLGQVLKDTFPGDPGQLLTLHDEFATDLPKLCPSGQPRGCPGEWQTAVETA